MTLGTSTWAAAWRSSSSNIGSDTDKTFQAFHLEALALRVVRHPNVVSLLDWHYATDANFRHGVCRKGQSLEELVDKKRFQAEESSHHRAPARKRLKRSTPRAAASGRVKPGHLILKPETLKLIDFGLVIPLSPVGRNAHGGAHAPGALHGHAFVHAPERITAVTTWTRAGSVFRRGWSS